MLNIEEFMSILNFKVRKFKSDFPSGKQLKNILTENASLPHRNFVIFSKKLYEKTMISEQKHEKYLKSKNGI